MINRYTSSFLKSPHTNITEKVEEEEEKIDWEWEGKEKHQQ